MKTCACSSNGSWTAGRALALLLLAALPVRGDVTTDVRRAFLREDPAVRAEVLRSAAARVAGLDRRARNRIAAAVGRGLKRERAPGPRIAALDLLVALHTGRALDRVVVAALDPREEVRAHLAALVRESPDRMLHEAIVRALREDGSWRMRAAMADLLLAGAWDRARRPLLDALGDEHPAVAARAAEALERLTGRAFGLDHARWEEWLRHREAPPPPRPDGSRRTVAPLPKRVKLYQGPVRGLTPRLYTIPIREKRVVFVVDMSSSMRRAVRSSHFGELKRAIFGLPSDTSFNILCFDQRLFFFRKAKSLVRATIEEKAAAERWLDDLPAGERTDVARSIVTGLAMLREALASDPSATAELFILTDGRETARTTSLRAVEAQYAKLPVDRCRIHLVALGRKAMPELRVLATHSGGRAVDATGH